MFETFCLQCSYSFVVVLDALHILVVLRTFKTLKGRSSCENVYTNVETYSNQDSDVRFVIAYVNNQEQDEDPERHKAEPLEDAVWQSRCKHASIKYQEESEKSGDQGLIKGTQYTVDVSIVGSEIIHLQIFRIGLIIT